MKKIVILCILGIITLSGCNNKTVNDVPFNVEFNQMNKDTNTAQFTVVGLPNEEEFNQLNEIIINSLNNQKLNSNVVVNVYVDSPENNGAKLSFGSCKYQDGKIIDNQLKNVSEEQYLKYA